MPIAISRLSQGKTGARHLNSVIAAIETALNGVFVGALPITTADVTGLDAALAAKQPLTGNTFTVATLPAAAAHVGRVVYVSNGSGGNPCAAISNGVDWKVLALGATVAAA